MIGSESGSTSSARCASTTASSAPSKRHQQDRVDVMRERVAGIQPDGLAKLALRARPIPVEDVRHQGQATSSPRRDSDRAPAPSLPLLSPSASPPSEGHDRTHNPGSSANRPGPNTRARTQGRVRAPARSVASRGSVTSHSAAARRTGLARSGRTRPDRRVAHSTASAGRRRRSWAEFQSRSRAPPRDAAPARSAGCVRSCAPKDAGRCWPRSIAPRCRPSRRCASPSPRRWRLRSARGR